MILVEEDELDDAHLLMFSDNAGWSGGAVQISGEHPVIVEAVL
jgi:hypothetical protein